MWSLVFLVWRLIGCVAAPILLLSRAARRHIISPPHPTPGAIWIHGASLGEHELVQAISTALENEHVLWRTHSTMRTFVKDSFPAPMDLPWVTEQWVKHARPKMLILVESELWPGWISACRKRNIPIVLLNLRAETKAKWQRWGLWKSLSQQMLIFDQATYGDLKLSIPPRRHPTSLPRPYFVGASTRNGAPADEQRLLEVWKTYQRPELLVLAPRRIERSKDILLCCSPLRSALWSQWNGEKVEVLIIDTHGELSGWIPDATAVFVGGSFDEGIGGHSPAAAIAAGVPVVAGPCRRGAIWKSISAQQVSTAAELNQCIEQATPTTSASSIAPILEQLPLSSPVPKEERCRPLLQPLTTLWRFWGRQQRSYQPSAVQPELPTISVGALTAGGSGKTPVSALLAQRLSAWVISHGYRRAGSDRTARMTGAMGDEAVMLQRRGLCVISAPDRAAGIRLANQLGATAVVLDDAFQHRCAPRSLDIVCIDCRYPLGGGQIPVGRARERWHALERADCIWLHEWSADLPLPELPPKCIIRSKMVPSHWRYQGQNVPLDAFTGLPKLICGIAVPSGLLSTIHQLHIHLEEWRLLSDHQPLQSEVDGWICSEKDAARLENPEKMWVLVCQLDVLDPDKLDALLQNVETTE